MWGMGNLWACMPACLPFRPIPGATANGRLAHRPVISVASALDSAVLVVTSGMGRPAPWSIWGLMTRI